MVDFLFWLAVLAYLVPSGWEFYTQRKQRQRFFGKDEGVKA